jgi:chemotaxis protein MotB
LKRSVGIIDPDIQINVEKELYSSQLLINCCLKLKLCSVRPQKVLAKVAKVVNKPDFECMVEGHTDNVPLTEMVF